MRITIKLPKPHPNQKKILSEAKRFNHIRCGRRFGKTETIKYLISESISKKTGIWFPTYKDLFKVWDAMKYQFYDIITRKDESLKHIKMLGGGEIDFWSMEDPNSGRGFDYDLAILDEAAKAKKLMEAWYETIRPTLTDRKGKGFMFSTPKGKTNDFYQIDQKTKQDLNWAKFHFSTYDNPYIDKSEIEDAKEQLDKLTFEQEYLGIYVDANDKPFLYSFDENKHVIEAVEPINYINPHLDLILSFDFNVDPMSCVVGQQTGLKDLVIFDEIRLENSGTEEMCNHILAKYPGFYYLATGDATGSRRTTNATGGKSDWRIIISKLELKSLQVRKRKQNLPLGDSRTLCNSVLQNANVKITANCTNLVNDFNLAAVDERGKLLKEESASGLHFFDCGRYMIDAVFPDFITNHRKYR